jgi:hypothetical protein
MQTITPENAIGRMLARWAGKPAVYATLFDAANNLQRARMFKPITRIRVGHNAIGYGTMDKEQLFVCKIINDVAFITNDTTLEYKNIIDRHSEIIKNLMNERGASYIESSSHISDMEFCRQTPQLVSELQLVKPSGAFGVITPDGRFCGTFNGYHVVTCNVKITPDNYYFDELQLVTQNAFTNMIKFVPQSMQRKLVIDFLESHNILTLNDIAKTTITAKNCTQIVCDSSFIKQVCDVQFHDEKNIMLPFDVDKPALDQLRHVIETQKSPGMLQYKTDGNIQQLCLLFMHLGIRFTPKMES